jgi:hypothetical protein
MYHKGVYNMDIKQGYKTSEFWLALASMIIGTLKILGIIPEAEADLILKAIRNVIAGLMVVIPVVGYAISRGMAKAGNNGS